MRSASLKWVIGGVIFSPRSKRAVASRLLLGALRTASTRIRRWGCNIQAVLEETTDATPCPCQPSRPFRWSSPTSWPTCHRGLPGQNGGELALLYALVFEGCPDGLGHKRWPIVGAHVTRFTALLDQFVQHPRHEEVMLRLTASARHSRVCAPTTGMSLRSARLRLSPR